MPDLPATNEEALKLADTVSALAEETHHPVPVVKEIFDEQYTRLKQTARCHDYLVLFATRQTKDALAKRARSQVAKPDVNARFRPEADKS
jgi:hypothetical protein